MNYRFFFNIKKLYVLLILSFFSCKVVSQNYFISGQVIDNKTKEPLAFVNIVVNNDKQLSQTDIDGKFKILYKYKIDSLKLSYVGYESAIFKTTEKAKNIIIPLEKKEILLNEVVIFPGINPAHRIINRAIENKDQNNPEKMGSFSYTSYNKMIITANLDSLGTHIQENDTSFSDIKNFLKEQYLFLMESVSENKFIFPDKVNENIIASKISGIKNPLFTLLFKKLQSFGFYNNIIQISGKNYISPLSKGSTDKYFFLLEDTLYQGNDSIFVISYKPRRGKNFDGLKGLLYINTNAYAIQNVTAEPYFDNDEMMKVKIQQKYEFIDNKQWFPVQLNFSLVFSNILLSDSASKKGDSKNNSSKNALVGEGKSYLTNIVLNPVLKKNEFSNIEMELPNQVNKADDKIWNAYRIDSLSEKDKRTYQIIDSISKVAKIDNKINTILILTEGKIPFKFLNFDIGKIVNYNDYEGWRLGLGLHNNYKLSKKITAGGYFAYGFKDKALKYGGDAVLNISKAHEISLGLSYFNDVTESGGISFYEQTYYLSNSGYREFLINRMDNNIKKEISLKFTALQYLKINMSFNTSKKSVTDNYFYGVENENISLLLNQYNFTELGVGLCYSYKEKFIKTPENRISLGTKYPIIYFNYSKGFNNILSGEYNFNRYELKITKSFFIKNLGAPALQFQTGYIDGDLPSCNLFNGTGSYRQFTIASSNSFATMRMNEFLSNRYAALFITHNFGKLLFRTKKFSPEIALATNLCIGDLNNTSKHFNLNFRNLSKGYIESGLLINNIINNKLYGIGFGAYYRYGYYALPTFKENIAYKFTVTFNI
ncbi:MAG: carboxypeptidase-like regulatory domain-containing protein [Bacteroidetes bacterium]|nr:carboxypeptidase-like regulatory domain-containing protein [Bacteroidota bacterium]